MVQKTISNKKKRFHLTRWRKIAIAVFLLIATIGITAYQIFVNKKDNTAFAGNSGTFDGVDDYVQIGNLSGSATKVEMYIKLIQDNQSILTLNNTVNGSLRVSGGSLTSGSSITITKIKVDGDIKTNAEAGAILNDNSWHKLEIQINSFSVTNLYLGCEIYTTGPFGNLSMASLKFNDGALGYYPFEEETGNLIYDVSGRKKHGVVYSDNLGPELLTNGGFDDWSNNVTGTITNFEDYGVPESGIITHTYSYDLTSSYQARTYLEIANNIFVGDKITIFNTTSYNGIKTIVYKIVSNNRLLIETSFNGDQSGNWEMHAVKVTSQNHALNTGDGITISGTTNYDGRYKIRKIDENSFYIGHSWMGSEIAGSWLSFADIPTNWVLSGGDGPVGNGFCTQGIVGSGSCNLGSGTNLTYGNDYLRYNNIFDYTNEKMYRVEIKITYKSGIGGFYVIAGNGSNAVSVNNGTRVYYFIPDNHYLSIKAYALEYATIDYVSVKEVKNTFRENNFNGTSFNLTNGYNRLLHFNGINNHIDIPNNPSLNIGAENFSFTLWLNREANLGSNMNGIFIEKGNSSNFGGFRLTYSLSGLSCAFRDNRNVIDGTYVGNVNFINNNNEWQYITIVVDRINYLLKFYQNGVFRGSQTIPTSLTSLDYSLDNGFHIGSYFHTIAPGFWRGSLKDIRFYKKALSDAEITTLYNGGDVSDQLTGYWKGYGKNNADWQDISGNGLNGTVYGTTDEIQSQFTSGEIKIPRDLTTADKDVLGNQLNMPMRKMYGEHRTQNELIGLYKFNETEYISIPSNIIDSSVTDSSSNDNNGQPFNGLSVTTNGRFRNAANFDGSDDYISIPDTTNDFDFGSGDFSIEGWIKTTKQDNADQIIYSHGTDANNYHELKIVDGKLVYRNIFAGTEQRRAETNAGLIQANQWYFVTLTIDRDQETTIYLNGEKQNLAVNNNPTESNNINFTQTINLGTDYSKTAGFYSGIMDEFAIYNYPRTAKEIRRTFSNMEGAY